MKSSHKVVIQCIRRKRAAFVSRRGIVGSIQLGPSILDLREYQIQELYHPIHGSVNRVAQMKRRHAHNEESEPGK